jgi:hypothetical protein
MNLDRAITLLDYIKEMNKPADEGYRLNENLDHWFKSSWRHLSKGW